MNRSVARRRTDLHPITPSLRDSATGGTKQRRRSPGRAVSMSRLDQLAKPRQYPHLLAPLHEKDSSERMSNSPPHSRTRSMTHLAGGGRSRGAAPAAGEVGGSRKLSKQLSRSSATLVRSTRAQQLRQQSRQSSGTIYIYISIMSSRPFSTADISHVIGRTSSSCHSLSSYE